MKFFSFRFDLFSLGIVTNERPYRLLTAVAIWAHSDIWLGADNLCRQRKAAYNTKTGDPLQPYTFGGYAEVRD